MSNHLRGQTSPYLLQHADNPVDWYPWGREALQKAKIEDKPIFLSIGYSTCHCATSWPGRASRTWRLPGFSTRALSPSRWTGRSDLTLTASTWRPARPSPGSGGWPTTLFLTPEQLPFFAGTYFPPTSRGGLTGLRQLLSAIRDAWAQDREALTAPGRQFLQLLTQRPPEQSSPTRPFWRRAWPSGNGPMMRHTAASAPPPNFPWGTVFSFCSPMERKRRTPPPWPWRKKLWSSFTAGASTTTSAADSAGIPPTGPFASPTLKKCSTTTPC